MANPHPGRKGPQGRKKGPQRDQCTTCRHPERAQIEHLLANGASQTSLGEKFGLSRDSIRRHYKNHVSDAVKAAALGNLLKPGADLKELVESEGAGLLQNLQRIRASLYVRFDAAVEAGDNGSVSSLAHRLHENLTLAARKTGELDAHIKVNNITSIVVSPAYLQLRTMLLTALRRHPARTNERPIFVA